MELWSKKLISTGRGTFEVFDKGSGTPLCVTHYYSEFNETGDYFADTFTGRHQVFLVNLREAGNSVKAEHPYQLSLLETVFDLEAIREAMKVESWSYAGHSIGGVLGVIYGIYFPERLTANVIVGAAARDYTTLSPQCIYNQQHPDYELMQGLMIALKSPELSPQERRNNSIERTKLSLKHPEMYKQLFNKSIHKKMSAARLNFFNRELQIFDVTRKLHLSSAKTLILCGEHDVQCPLEYSIEMSELIPNSELVVFRESNHYPFLEEKERFKQEVSKFFEKVD
ncbi:alpha/beta fold hydrolase [Halobacillus sp. BBL2006]|uniref:alpha/beta fold hydrolase n=1 Tax=Halobacillus sp. BBL2006 TaxID=1543706 RepID=UPI0005442EBC|nr:alpha/beta hydrolase [Halobacillus sp. BBL2006]KHE73200.1 proline iminopeptidase [Halobacillus sp. BBL2006]